MRHVCREPDTSNPILPQRSKGVPFTCVQTEKESLSPEGETSVAHTFLQHARIHARVKQPHVHA